MIETSVRVDLQEIFGTNINTDTLHTLLEVFDRIEEDHVGTVIFETRIDGEIHEHRGRLYFNLWSNPRGRGVITAGGLEPDHSDSPVMRFREGNSILNEIRRTHPNLVFRYYKQEMNSFCVIISRETINSFFDLLQEEISRQ